MLGLLRGDLYRALRVRGNVFWYLIVFVVVVVGNVAFAALFGQAINDMFANAAAEAAAEAGTEEEAAAASMTALVDMFANFSTPTNFMGASMMAYGFMTLMVCWCVTNFAWCDLRDGYAKGMVSGVGKGKYFGEKMLFALVLSVVFVVIGAVVGLGLTMLTGIGFKGDDSVAQILLWCVLTALITWGCACLCLGVLWIVRNQVLVYLLAFLLASGFLSGLLLTIITNIPNMESVASALAALVDWLPRGAVGALNTGTLGAVDVLGGSAKDVVSIALTGMVILRVVVTSAACVAIGYACSVVARKRDL